MRIYSKILCLLAASSFLSCLLINVCGYICYDWIYGGAKLNIVGCVLTTFTLWGMILFAGSYKIMTFRHNYDFHFPWWAIAIYVALVANGIYIAFAMRSPQIEGESTFTGTKLMFYLALSLILNFTVFLDAISFLKSVSR